jgi:hypothetical protein
VADAWTLSIAASSAAPSSRLTFIMVFLFTGERRQACAISGRYWKSLKP